MIFFIYKSKTPLWIMWINMCINPFYREMALLIVDNFSKMDMKWHDFFSSRFLQNMVYEKLYDKSQLYYTSCCHRCAIIQITRQNSIFRIAGMYHSAIANTYCHMVYRAVFRIKYQISCLCSRRTDTSSYSHLGTGSSWKANSKITEDRLGKTGTVCSIC